MSIIVDIPDLADAVADRPWGYLLTVGPDLDVHVLAVARGYEGGVFTVHAGRTARANATARPEVTLVFPPVGGEGRAAMSLIIDGTASLHDEHLAIEPRAAVLHRAAPAS